MFQFNTRTMVGYNQRVAYTSTIEGTLVGDCDIRYIPLGEQSLTGNFQVSEDLTLRFTHDIVDVGVRGNATYSYTHNNSTAASTSNVFNWTVTGDLEFHLPKSWNISAECSYTDRYGYELSGKVNEVILNAEIEKSWEAMHASRCKPTNILHQKKNIRAGGERQRG